jgi:hypothetical protein
MDARTVTVSHRLHPRTLPWGKVAVAVFSMAFASVVTANIRELEIAGPASTDQQRVRSTLLNNGMIVFAWEDQSGSDSDVHYRLFNPATSVFSAILTANVTTDGDQADPVITSLFNGGFAIAFASRPVGGDYDVLFRRFDSSGVALDVADVPVNTIVADSQQHPDITTLDDGSFVVAFSGPTGSGQDIFFRRFSPVGVALDAAEVLLNAFGLDAVTAGDQGGVKIDTFPEGGWMAVFEDRGSDDLYGVRFSNAGTPYQDPDGATDEFYFRLNDASANEQFGPSLAAFGDEQFAVVYNSDTDGTATGRRVLLRIFNSGGPVTGEILVGAANRRSQDADAAFIDGPNLAVAWTTLEPTGGGDVWSVYSQIFTLGGSPIGAPLFMHTDQSLNHGRPHVIPWLDGGFTTVWESGNTVGARTVAPSTASPGVMSAFLAGPSETQTYQISFLGFPGECYELQAADALNNWSTILTTNAPTGGFFYTDPDGATTPHRFFQVKRKLSGL